MTVLLTQCDTRTSTASTTGYVDEDMELVWSDEFDYEGLPDSTKWGYHLGDACDLPMGCGWGNNELQYYTDRPGNARVAGGTLIIEAHRQNVNGRKYTSSRLVTQGKGDWLYGRFEIRAQVPQGRGVWAAIWMLPSDGDYGIGKYGPWPHSGEIDIMEHVGFDKDTIVSNTHTLSANGMHGTDDPGRVFVPTAEEAFHTYAIEWTPEKIDFYVDDQNYHTYHRESSYEVWPFNQPFYLIMNIAVGGNWGGRHGIDDESLPWRMKVDYVRVFQKAI